MRDDRVFVRVRLAGEHEPELDALADTLERLGHPVERLELADPLDVGAEFLRWEVATAAAGIALGIDPFDQPNVQESKDAHDRAPRRLPDPRGAPGADAARQRAWAWQSPPTRLRWGTCR